MLKRNLIEIGSTFVGCKAMFSGRMTGRHVLKPLFNTPCSNISKKGSKHQRFDYLRLEDLIVLLCTFGG